MSSIHSQSASLNQLCQEDYGKVTEAFFSKTRIRSAIRGENKIDMTERTCQVIHVPHSNACASNCCCVTATSGYPKIVNTQWHMLIGFHWPLIHNWREKSKGLVITWISILTVEKSDLCLFQHSVGKLFWLWQTGVCFYSLIFSPALGLTKILWKICTSLSCSLLLCIWTSLWYFFFL